MNIIVSVLAASIAAQPVAGSDTLEPSVLNEVRHALSRVPARIAYSAHGCAKGKSAAEQAVALVSAQRQDGRWIEGGVDVTYAAAARLRELAADGGRWGSDEVCEADGIPYVDEGDAYRRERCLLDVKVPRDAKGFKTIVWFHGGGLTGGGRHFIPIHDRSIAQVGVGYRLMKAGNGVQGEDCIRDAAAAVAWTLGHIAEFGGDPEKVYVSGMSAGGYLTMMVGMAPQYLAEFGCSPKDLAGLIPVSGQATKHFNVRKYSGDEEPQYLSKVDPLSPLAWCSPELPPILSVCGQPPWEWKCRAEENRLLISSCVALGHPCAHYVELPYCDHGRAYTAALPYVEMFVQGRLPFASPKLEDANDPEPKKVTKEIRLLEDGRIDRHWYIWLRGVKSRDCDPKKVFTAAGGVLKVSGEDMGCVTTREAYRDYRLSLDFRFVDHPRQLNRTAARDSGILFHSTGIDGAFNGVWMSSFEYNIIQGACGDMLAVGDRRRYPGRYRLTGTVAPDSVGKPWQHWDPSGKSVTLVDGGRIRRPDVDHDWKNLINQALSPNEKPVGEWNHVELICAGDRAEFRFNGMLVGEYSGLSPYGGRIQLQSEGFGIEYRDIVLRPLEDQGK